MSSRPQTFIDGLYNLPSDNIHPKDLAAGMFVADTILGNNAILQPPPPTFASLSPATANPGTVVTINGTNFTATTTPTWTGGNQPTFTYVSPTAITFVAPQSGSYTVAGLSLTVTVLTSLQTGPVTGTGTYVSELGVVFRCDTAGYLRRFRYTRFTGMPVGVLRLWDNAGSLLQTINFVGETATGLQTQNVAPIALTAGSTYRLSMHFPGPQTQENALPTFNNSRLVYLSRCYNGGGSAAGVFPAMTDTLSANPGIQFDFYSP
jgi:hypothetical protein